MGPVELYRLSARLHRRGFRRAARVVKALNLVIYSAVIPPELIAGDNLKVGHHGVGLVIHPNTTVGDDVFIYHGVTLAADIATADPRRQVIGSNVTIGAGAIVLGPITVGDNATIGAGAVVTKDVPDDAVVAGVPAQILSLDGARHQKR